MNKFTEGCQKVGNRFRLYETIDINSDTIVEKQLIKEKLTENVNGMVLPVYGTYTVKLWSLKEKNKNGRSYKKVINKVLNENKITVGLINHPEDGLGNPKDIFAVEKHPQILNEWLCIDITFVGSNGADCNAILEAGGPLEFSSSALGDVDFNGDVIEEGFELERYADRVFSPSNGISLFKEEEIQDEKQEIPILHEDDKNKLEESLTILNKDDGEKIMPDKLTEINIALNIKGMLKEVDKTEDFSEKKQLLESALKFATELTDKSLQTSIEEKIISVDKEVHTLAEKGKGIDSLQKNVTSLTENNSSLSEEKEKLTKEVANLTENLNKIQEDKEKIDKDYKVLVEMYEKKEYESGKKTLDINKSLNKTVISLKNKNKKLDNRSEYFEALSNTKVDADIMIKLKEENDILKKKIITLKKLSLKEFKKDVFKNKDVKEYYETLLEKDDSIEKYKDRFISCNSLREAYSIKMNLNDDDDDVHTPFSQRIRDSYSNPSRLNMGDLEEEKNNKKGTKSSAWQKELDQRGLF